MSDQARRPTRPKTRVVLGALLTVLVVAGVSFAITVALHQSPNPTDDLLPPASTTLHIGERAPLNFALPRLGGGSSVLLASHTNGRPVVLNFFASWCPACAAELGAFSSTARHFGTSVSFVGIDTDDTGSAALRLLHAAHITYPVGVEASAGTLVATYGVSSLPVTIIVDSSGKVRGTLLGKQTSAVLERLLTPLVAAAHR